VDRRVAQLSSVGLCSLVAVCCWRLLAAVLDARHFQPDAVESVTVSSPDSNAFQSSFTSAGSGHPTWIIASTFADRSLYLLVIGGAAAVWLNQRYDLNGTVIRGALTLLALCAAGTTVIGVGALFDRNMATATLDLGPYPDTMRANAGEEILIGMAVLVAVDLLARARQRAVGYKHRAALESPRPSRQQPATNPQSAGVAAIATPLVCGQCGLSLVGPYCHNCGTRADPNGSRRPARSRSPVNPLQPALAHLGKTAKRRPIAFAGTVAVLVAAIGVGSWSLSRQGAGPAATRTAETNLRNALTAEQTVWTNNQQFSPASQLGAVEPTLPFANYPATPTAMTPGTVYIWMLDGADVELSAVAGKKLYTIVQSNNATTDPSTLYGVTAVSAGRPDPAKITDLSW